MSRPVSGAPPGSAAHCPWRAHRLRLLRSGATPDSACLYRLDPQMSPMIPPTTATAMAAISSTNLTVCGRPSFGGGGGGGGAGGGIGPGGNPPLALDTNRHSTDPSGTAPWSLNVACQLPADPIT